MRMFRVSFLVEDGSLATIIASIGACATSGLAIAENVPEPAPPPSKKRRGGVKPPELRSADKSRSRTFHAAMSVLDDTAPLGEITEAQLIKAFEDKGLRHTSVGPCMTYMVAKNYVHRVRPGLYRKTP